MDPVFRQLDITDKISREAMKEYLTDTFGGLDCLVNNAGDTPYRSARVHFFYDESEANQWPTLPTNVLTLNSTVIQRSAALYGGKVLVCGWGVVSAQISRLFSGTSSCGWQSAPRKQSNCRHVHAQRQTKRGSSSCTGSGSESVPVQWFPGPAVLVRLSPVTHYVQVEQLVISRGCEATQKLDRHDDVCLFRWWIHCTLQVLPSRGPRRRPSRCRQRRHWV